MAISSFALTPCLKSVCTTKSKECNQQLGSVRGETHTVRKGHKVVYGVSQSAGEEGGMIQSLAGEFHTYSR